MKTLACPQCTEEFPYDPARPNKRFCTPQCGDRARGRTNVAKNEARARRAVDHDVEFIGVDGEGVTRRRPVTFLNPDTGESEYVTEWDPELQTEVPVMDTFHDYVLLSVGDQNLYRPDGRALRHDEIFEFLYEQKRANPHAVFVGYFLGYDFSQWFKSLPEGKGWKLFTGEGKQHRMPRNPDAKFPFPVQDGRWEFDILGMKRFKLRPFVRKADRPQCTVAHKTPDQIEECAAGKHNKNPNPWMYICDTGAYFQAALLSVVKPTKKNWPNGPVVSDEEYAILEAGKGERAVAQFDTAEQRAEMIRYNVLENEVLARLMKVLNEGFVADEIRLKATQWFGPGQAAQTWMTNIGAPTGEEVAEAVPHWALSAARDSYYGGWFETFIHGPIDTEIYEYDINSAYPEAISHLPCLLHGRWSHGKGKPGKLPVGVLRLVYGRFVGEHNAAKDIDPIIGTMPHRDEFGGISRPIETVGWHWQHEVDAARRAGMVKRAVIVEWVQYDPCDCPKPFAKIRDLYESRIRVGKNSPAGKAKKLTYNSAYGKLAQSIGAPKFANPIYASYITSYTRTMICDAIATHPEGQRAVAMVATDGVYFTSPHPTLPIDSERLGLWDTTTKRGMSILMPGLYWDDESREGIRTGEGMKLKSRGISGKYLAPMIDGLDAQWLRLRERMLAEGPADRFMNPVWMEHAPKAVATIEFSVVSPKLAASQNRWQKCGLVQWDLQRVIDANPDGKRGRFHIDSRDPSLLRSRARLLTPGELESHPYRQSFGMEFDDTIPTLRDLTELYTRDGTADDDIHAVLPD